MRHDLLIVGCVVGVILTAFGAFVERLFRGNSQDLVSAVSRTIGRSALGVGLLILVPCVWGLR